ncbi:hypothetical protein B0H13DRAFT_1646174, partial [Mycena leptocephala]
ISSYFFSYLTHIETLATEYEWAAVLEYHMLFFNRRRTEMQAGLYTAWSSPMSRSSAHTSTSIGNHLLHRSPRPPSAGQANHAVTTMSANAIRPRAPTAVSTHARPAAKGMALTSTRSQLSRSLAGRGFPSVVCTTSSLPYLGHPCHRLPRNGIFPDSSAHGLVSSSCTSP